MMGLAVQEILSLNLQMVLGLRSFLTPPHAGAGQRLVSLWRPKVCCFLIRHLDYA